MALVLTAEQIEEGWICWEAKGHSSYQSGEPNLPLGTLIHVMWNDGHYDPNQNPSKVTSLAWFICGPETTVGAYKVVKE